LHYEQEISFSKIIKKLNPFSIEQNTVMRNGYETVNKIMAMIKIKEGKYLVSFGAHNSYIKFVDKIIKNRLKQKSTCFFFEAGVGTGKIISSIANNKDVHASGCDIYVDKNFLNSDLNVYEGTIYEALTKVSDNCIDVFYWNDVIEHIPEDEIDILLILLASKMAIGGIIITITPNRLNGPSDITSHFEPRGTIAKGFHFHEYTFAEMVTLFEKYNFKSKYILLGYLKRGCYILTSLKIILKIKLVGEKIAAKFPWPIKKKILGILGCDISIFIKVE
jgi:hypothetical protein